MTFVAAAGWPLRDRVEEGKAEATGVTGSGQGPPRWEELTGVALTNPLAGREARAISTDASSVTGATGSRTRAVPSGAALAAAAGRSALVLMPNKFRRPVLEVVGEKHLNLLERFGAYLSLAHGEFGNGRRGA